MSGSPRAFVTAEQYEIAFAPLHLIHAAVDHWAVRDPDGLAILNATRATSLTWAELSQRSRALAAELSRLGFRKGDYFATSLPLLDEHILLEYACFRLGVIHTPLDLRLQPAELLRSIALVGAKGYAFPGKLGPVDFGDLAGLVRAKCDTVEHLLQFAAPQDCIAPALAFSDLLGRAQTLDWEEPEISPTDGAQVIFTTGSTGSPKAALLSHRGITCQNLCLGTAFGFGPGQRVLCNLPASHVGGQSELLLTSLFMGGTAVTLEIFDPVKSLDAIERYKVTLLGQIPAMFNLEWRTADYGARDLASLRLAVYGGQSVPPAFLDRMLEMAPSIGTGLGLTETSGFCTYTPPANDAATIAAGIGFSMPAYPVSIRDAMSSGAAGSELEPGQVGHICFRGPQNFLGYVKDDAATAATLSSDGWLYTGDLGSLDETGLHFAGRAKWVLKPRGYQVFPGDVENHLSQIADKVAAVGVVGHEHERWSEGIIAFVEKRAGVELTESELRKHARSLTSYMRPLHYVILDAGTMPLNRTAKVDIPKLQVLAQDEVRRLRERGRWDGDAEPPDAILPQ